MSDIKEAELRVGELTAREEFGRGIVRLDSNTMQKIGVKEGDIVEIEGSRKVGALAIRAYPSDAGINVIRMDGLVRRNASTGVGDTVKVRKADVKEAKSITLAPAQRNVFIQIHPSLIKQNIYYRPVAQGDIIVPSPVVKRTDRSPSIFQEFFGFDFEEFFFSPAGETRFVVTSTNPKGIVQIGEITEVEILPQLPKGFELEKRKVPAVTYEDVGGIHQAILKVREMIELPLRHPELFSRLGIEPPKGVLLHGPPGTGKTLLARAVANEAGANFYSISGPEFYSKWYGQSLRGDELVFTIEDGMVKRIPIKEIVENKKTDLKVLTFDKRGKVKWSKIRDVFKHKNRYGLFEIKTRTGRKITVTDDHSLFTLNGTKIDTIKASELMPKKSYIAIPRRIPLPENTVEKFNFLETLRNDDYNLRVGDVGDYIERAIKKIGKQKVAFLIGSDINKNKIRISKFFKLVDEVKLDYDVSKLKIYSQLGKPLPAELIFDEDFCTFLGLWVAEGSYNKSAVNISTNKNEKEKIKGLIGKLFGHVTEYRRGNAVDFKINSKVLAVLLRHGLKMEPGAHNKKIPEVVFNLDKKLMAAFLRGYFSGDGSIYKNQRGVPTIEADTESKNLADDLIHLLLFFEIVAKNIERERPTGKQNRIYFQGSQPIMKFKEIGFLDSEKNQIIENYLQQIKWTRDQQIPMNEPLKATLIQVPEASQWIRADSSTIGRDVLGGFVNAETGLEFGLNMQAVNEIEELTTNDIYWDRVEEIKEVENEGYVYDISVSPNENFLAGFGGIFAHNTEANLRRIFEEAEKNAPSIIFIDEIDAVAPKREEVTGEVEKRTVSQLLTLMDGLKKRGKVIVIAATNRPDALDPAIRRGGRFDREIEIGVPDRQGRKEIFQIHTRHMPLDKDVNLDDLSDITYGYVGADLEALAKEAAMHALRRLLPKIKWKEEEELPKDVLEKLIVNKKDFQEALKMVEPSAMREVLIEVPKVKWSDVGGLDDVKQQLKEMIEWPLTNPESFENIGIKPPRGILLYGPPGCGKTLLAKSVATESNANFISVKGPELLSKWVGESEKRVRELFRRAKQVSPSIIFFDEIDALAPKRGVGYGEHVTEKIVSQLLTEMSGLEELKDVVVVAATNRPDMLDPALLRPGRFDRQILVPAPDEKTRLRVLEIKTKDMPLKGVDLKKLAKETEDFSGADLEALAREAGMFALRENKKANEVNAKHFEKAKEGVKASLDAKILSFYNKFDERFRKKIMEEAKEDRTLSYVG